MDPGCQEKLSEERKPSGKESSEPLSKDQVDGLIAAQSTTSKDLEDGAKKPQLSECI